MTSDPTGSYTYTSSNQIASATVSGTLTTYGYDANGTRAVKSGPNGTQYFVYGLGGQMLAEYTNTTTGPVLMREYVYLGSQRIASIGVPDDTAPPVSVTLTSPAAGRVGDAGTSVTLSADTHVTSGTISQVAFYANGVLIGTVTSAPYTCSWTITGSATLTARVVLTSGLVVTSAGVAVVDGTADPTAAVMTAPTASTVLSGSTQTFTWAAGSGGYQYYLWVGTSVAHLDLWYGTPGTGLSDTVTGLPTDGSPIYVRLWTLIWAGAAYEWIYHDYTYTTGSSSASTEDMAVTVLGPGTGSVTSSPSGIALTGPDASGSASFTANSTVTLTASPSSGNIFVGWGGACSGTSTTCTVPTDVAQSVVAAFRATPSPTITYYHLDVLGSMRATTDGGGSPLVGHDFMAYGEEYSATPTTTDAARYIGQPRDTETNFDDFGARPYVSLIGRFGGVDPGQAGASLFDPQRWNAYGYARNNPLTFLDPSGLDAQAKDPPPPPQFTDQTTVTATFEFVNLLQMLYGVSPTLFWDFISPGDPVPQSPPPAPLVQDPPGPTRSLPSRIAQGVCSALPQGRAESINGSIGGIGGENGSLSAVINYSSGQVSGFATAGLQVGWNGIAQASASTGLIYGALGSDNRGYSGRFATASGSATLFGGFVSGGGGVVVAGPSIGVSMTGGTFGTAVTATSAPLPMGNVTTSSLATSLDWVMILARRATCR